LTETCDKLFAQTGDESSDADQDVKISAALIDTGCVILVDDTSALNDGESVFSVDNLVLEISDDALVSATFKAVVL